MHLTCHISRHKTRPTAEYMWQKELQSSQSGRSTRGTYSCLGWNKQKFPPAVLPEQHICQCGVFLCPRTTGKTWWQRASFTPAGVLRFLLRGLQPNITACILYSPGDVMGAPVSMLYLGEPLRGGVHRHTSPSTISIEGWCNNRT